MSDDRMFVAVDLGAGSGRVFLAGVAEDEFLFDEMRRFTYPPRQVDGRLRWDARHIFSEVAAGLAAAGARARVLGRPVESVGADSWGVDYGLVDATGTLLDDPVCYRDGRTAGAVEQVCARIARGEIFERTGIQLLSINTLFQFFVHARSGIPAAAHRLLLMPDLVHAFLTGVAVTEYTNATTTQMLGVGTGTWDVDLVEQLGLPSRLLAPLVRAGDAIGALRPALRDETGFSCTRVVAPATHDTGSAVAGTPLRPGWAFVSSGTWSLVGIERAHPLVNADVARHNFTNEGGVLGTIRFLKNITGLWLLEACRREWQAAGRSCDHDALVAGAAALETSPGLVFPDDPRFMNPPSMLAALAAQLAETGQSLPEDPAAVTRIVLDSLALRYASVIGTIESLTGARVEGVQVVGGGSRNTYLNQATASATGRPVAAGPVEATVIGNVLMQALAAGRFGSIDDARRYVAAHVSPRAFEPVTPRAWEGLRARYAGIEDRFAPVVC